MANKHTRAQYYEITYNSDSNEGRGSTLSTGIFFWNHCDALTFVKSDRYARKFGVMGTPGSEYDIATRTAKLKIYESIVEYDEENPNKEELERIKKDVLARLTAKERRALGM